MAFLFENLAVYQKAMDFTEQIVTLTESFPRGYCFLADQLNRALLSIATNLAEGNGRFTKPDRKNFFIIARALRRNAFPYWNWRAEKVSSTRHRIKPCASRLRPLPR